MSALLILLGVGLKVSLWALRYRAPCPLPCQDLGREPVPGEPLKAWGPFTPRCAPVKIDLELARPEAKTGHRYTLWFKLRLTNVSCYKLSLINAGPLIWWFYENRLNVPNDFIFHVQGPDGIEVKNLKHAAYERLPREDVEKLRRAYPHVRLRSKDTGYLSEYGDVIPYEDDLAAWDRMRANPHLSMDDHAYVTLQPGQSLESTVSVFAPHTEHAEIEHLSGGVGYTTAHAPVALDGAEVPVPGYRIMDQYIFWKPGRYTIRVAYNPSFVTGEPIYPYAERVPWQMQKLLSMLGLARGMDLSPADRDEAYFQIHAESSTLSFEVKP